MPPGGVARLLPAATAVAAGDGFAGAPGADDPIALLTRASVALAIVGPTADLAGPAEDDGVVAAGLASGFAAAAAVALPPCVAFSGGEGTAGLI